MTLQIVEVMTLYFDHSSFWRPKLLLSLEGEKSLSENKKKAVKLVLLVENNSVKKKK